MTEPAPVVEVSAEQEEPDYGYNEELTESERQTVVRAARRRVNVTADTAAPYDISYRPGRVLLYSPPRQRQRWNDTRV